MKKMPISHVSHTNLANRITLARTQQSSRLQPQSFLILRLTATSANARPNIFEARPVRTFSSNNSEITLTFHRNFLRKLTIH